MGIIFTLINVILYVFDLLLIVRAICSWVDSFRQSMVYRFAFTVTEPILRPVRDLLFKIEWVRRCPLDLSFLAVVLLVNALMSVTSYLAVVL